MDLLQAALEQLLRRRGQIEGDAVPLVCQVPLLPLSPVRGAALKRHQWSIDAAPATSMEH